LVLASESQAVRWFQNAQSGQSHSCRRRRDEERRFLRRIDVPHLAQPLHAFLLLLLSFRLRQTCRNICGNHVLPGKSVCASDHPATIAKPWIAHRTDGDRSSAHNWPAWKRDGQHRLLNAAISPSTFSPATRISRRQSSTKSGPVRQSAQNHGTIPACWHSSASPGRESSRPERRRV
jgi:hypothetical protein